MKLYHYCFKKEILSEGLVSSYKHPDTQSINDLIVESFGDCFGRDCCVFLNMDRRDDGYITLSVDSEKLNSKLLYVADQDLANSVYRNWYRGNDCSEVIKQYINSIKKMNQYSGEYSNPEVFYLDDISSDIITVEHIDEESF